MKTSILLSTSANIKLPTGGSPFESSSSLLLESFLACSFRFAKTFRAIVSSPAIFLRGRTSGNVLGRYHRLNIFSLIKSPWYARTTALDTHLCWKSDREVRVKDISEALSPTVLRHKLYKLRPPQLFFLT
jgi:hypothetical protein